MVACPLRFGHRTAQRGGVSLASLTVFLGVSAVSLQLPPSLQPLGERVSLSPARPGVSSPTLVLPGLGLVV